MRVRGETLIVLSGKRLQNGNQLKMSINNLKGKIMALTLKAHTVPTRIGILVEFKVVGGEPKLPQEHIPQVL